MAGSDSNAAWRRRERLRRRYRPSRLRLLFIGESPPASGRLFYQCDSGLYRAIRDSFRAIDASLTDTEFLPVFQAAGCYLIDLCPFPVDQLDSAERRAACIAGEALLCRAIRRLQPEAVVTVVRSIKGKVDRAAACAGWQGRLIDLPYPGRWSRHRSLFVNALTPELRAIDFSAPPPVGPGAAIL